MLRRLIAGGTVVVSALLPSCSIAESKQRAEPCAFRFNDAYNTEQYGKIHADADPALQAQTTEADLTRMLASLHRKLGAVREARPSGWYVHSSFGGGSSVRLTYAAGFERGEGTETFNVVVDGPSCKLAGFNVSSPALLAD
jgi:hypothetical protein